ncbi:MAG TPA: hypothetical protein VFV03_08145 [Solirubrobacteraceae bacterium]|nr:hypothetical protein [Solirubrobacteraceae bacterium]
MSQSFDSTLPSDIRLLLHADAEQCWLHREVIPVLRQVETCEQLPDEQVGAAIAYLEATWNEATLRARATDAAHAHLCSRYGRHEKLSGAAGRYHTAVRVLRGIVAQRVTPIVAAQMQADGKPIEAVAMTLRVSASRRPPAGGCTPRAA